MASIQKAWNFVLDNEDPRRTGEVVVDNNGAKVRYGINSLAHPEALARGFYSMAKQEAYDFAEDLFKYDYWSQIMGYNIQSDLIGAKWADLAFNAAPKEATLLVQRAVNTMREKPIRVDGICGCDTLASVNAYLDTAEVEKLYQAIIMEGSLFYEMLHAKNSIKFPLNLEKAWLGRLDKRPNV